MKKIIVVVAGIIILAVIGTPFFNGLIMERVIRQAFGDINRMHAETGSDVSIEIQKYDRGFSRSQIEWKISTGPLKALYGVEDIIFVDRAEHGFSGIVSTTSLEKNKWYTEFVNEKLNGKTPLEIKTQYMLSGDIKSTLTLAAFSFIEGRDVIEIQPGTLSVFLDKGLKNNTSEMTWAGCSIPGKFKMDSFSLQSKIKKISPVIWEGTVSFFVNHIMADNKKNQFDLSKLKGEYTLDYSQEEQVVSIGMGYGLDTLKSGENEIKNAGIRIGINHIDARGYEDFVKMYSQIMSNALREISASQQSRDTMKKAAEKQMTQMGIQLLGAYEKLLKKGLEIKLSDLRAQLPHGNINGDVALSLKKDMTMAQFLPIMMQPSAALDIFYLKSEITLPYQLMEGNPDLMSRLFPGMQTGLFLKVGNNLVHKAETRDGKLFLNEKEVFLN
ncbi:MAG: YdgA family protein [Proteobacteria bacterium]|nr:YdgA family protein [Pseudomonadota bacterium]MBU1583022.1 YdgA family protein [Pseudomonadota bacterium]MBU2454790.1 YdgA family protein [Pseudomonadota bacterium]MBU2627942.1 YdgA family protein [Pseudomonadota bacterium]